MSTFEKTQSSLSELRTTRSLEVGGHISSVPQQGPFGIRLGEVRFDPSRHQVSDINLFSITEQVTGLPHVQEVMPRKSMFVQIIEDRTASVNTDTRIAQLKANLTQSLTEAVMDSKSDRDRVRHYLIDRRDNKSLLRLNYNFEVIDPEIGSEGIAESISEICLKGLSFIVSDFKRFDLSTQPKNKFGKTVAIKVNHPAELYIKPGKYTIPTGEKPIRAWKPKELDPKNDELRERNRVIVDDLESVGIKVAQVVLKPTSFMKFDVAAADKAISRAVTRVKESR